MWESEITAQLILNLNTIWQRAVTFMTCALHRYTLSWRLGGPHSQSGGFEEAIIPLPLPRIEPINLVIIPTTLKLKVLYAETSQGRRKTAYYCTCSSDVQVAYF